MPKKPLTPEQRKKLRKLADVLEKGNAAFLEYLFEIDEKIDKEMARIDKSVPNLETIFENVRGQDGAQGPEGEKGEKGEKGDKGDPGKDGRDGRDGKNGRDGKDGKDGRDGEDGKDGLDGKDGEMGMVDDATIAYLEAEIKRLEELMSKPVTRNGRVIAPSRGIYSYIDGVKKGLLSNINFKAGTNVSIAHSKVNGQDTFTFNATGGGPGGISVETPTGTVNGVNDTFGVSDEPLWVVGDGTTYYAGAGYTYSAPNVIMDIPPSASIRAII